MSLDLRSVPWSADLSKLSTTIQRDQMLSSVDVFLLLKNPENVKAKLEALLLSVQAGNSDAIVLFILQRGRG